MKKNRKYSKIAALLLALLMTIASAVPTFAATERPIIGVSFPTSVTVKVGQSTTIYVSTSPSNTTHFTNIQWGYQTNGAFTNKVNGYGTLWNQASSSTITGQKVGKGYMYTTVQVYDSTRKHVNTFKVNTTVNVVANNTNNNTGSNANPATNTSTPKPAANTSTPKKTTPKKVALKSIKLNKSKATLTAGSNMKLTVKYNPSNTTVSKKVTWKSSNKKIATVSGGKVVAKKAGTVKITAKVGSKKATCKITVKKKPKATPSNTVKKPSTNTPSTSNEKYLNVSDAYSILNTFRTTKSNQWYWNQSNTAKVTCYGLKPLTRDPVLENVAKVRAKEAWTQYYANGKLTHDRPNGQSCWTAYPSNSNPSGENLAWGQTTSKSVITDANGWAETNDKYAGQGHRRNMLSSSTTRVGIACYEKNGKTAWAMCLGY